VAHNDTNESQIKINQLQRQSGRTEMLQSNRENEINRLSLLDSVAHHETNESQIEIDLLQRQTGQTEMLQSNTNEENIQLSLLHTLQNQDLTENSIKTNQQCTQSDFYLQIINCLFMMQLTS